MESKAYYFDEVFFNVKNVSWLVVKKNELSIGTEFKIVLSGGGKTCKVTISDLNAELVLEFLKNYGIPDESFKHLSTQVNNRSKEIQKSFAESNKKLYT